MNEWRCVLVDEEPFAAAAAAALCLEPLLQLDFGVILQLQIWYFREMVDYSCSSEMVVVQITIVDAMDEQQLEEKWAWKHWHDQSASEVFASHC